MEVKIDDEEGDDDVRRLGLCLIAGDGLSVSRPLP